MFNLKTGSFVIFAISFWRILDVLKTKGGFRFVLKNYEWLNTLSSQNTFPCSKKITLNDLLLKKLAEIISIE